MSDSWKAALDTLVGDLEGEIIANRRHLHAHPEPSGAELETSLRLYQQLGETGLAVRMGPEGCGVIADNSAPDGSSRVALRADIDALLIQDEKSVSYRSTRPGVMHACGHDAHTAIALGAAKALSRLEESGRTPWPLAWRVVFQPSEETAVGARRMIAAGAVDGVRSIVALHVDPARRTGEIGVRSGAFTANCDALRLRVNGRGGHGARPHESKDPIAAAAQLVSTLYQFIPRATDSLDAVVLTFGRIAGGQNSNVIPEYVELDGTLRTLEAGVRARTIEHIHRLAGGIEEITGTQIELTLGASIPSVFNDPATTQLLAHAAVDVAGSVTVAPISRPSMGSEDFACYLEHCHGAMFRLGIAADLGAMTPLHTSRFDIDERALVIGARLLARTVVLACKPANAPGA